MTAVVRPKSRHLTPGEKLARLKVVVEHIGQRWPVALGRHVCLKEFGTNAELHKLLSPSYAAHVHNMMQDVLMTDLIREIGAAVLDDDDRSASVAVALGLLGDSDVCTLLEKDYHVGIPTAIYGIEEYDEALQKELADAFAARELDRNLQEYRDLEAKVRQIPGKVLNTEGARRVSLARNKAVAHYDIVQDGQDCRIWTLGDAKLTYGQIDAFVNACTECIDTLSLFVRRAAFDFEGSLTIDKKQVAEYVDALCAGLRGHRIRERIRRLVLTEQRAVTFAGRPP